MRAIATRERLGDACRLLGLEFERLDSGNVAFLCPACHVLYDQWVILCETPFFDWSGSCMGCDRPAAEIIDLLRELVRIRSGAA